MAIKDQKNVKTYVNLTKSMLNEQDAPNNDKQKRKKDKALRKKTADNILRYLNTSESAAEEKIKKAIQIASNPLLFEPFKAKMIEIVEIADYKLAKFAKRVLNYSNLSISSNIGNLDKEIEDILNSPDLEAEALSIAARKKLRKSRKGTRGSTNLKNAKDAYEISNTAKKAKAEHLKNLRVLASKLKSSRIDSVKVFSLPANVDVFSEARAMFIILNIFEDFDRIGKNLEGNATETLEYLEIITPQRMTELYKSSRKEFNKIITILVQGAFAADAAMGARIAKAKQEPKTLSGLVSGTFNEIFDTYENKILQLENPDDWYNKLRDKNHEYRITLDDWVRCFKKSKQQKIKIFQYMLASAPNKVIELLDRMEDQMSKTGRCRPDPEDRISFFENKNIIKEELTIRNETENNLDQFIQTVSDFYPYSKDNLGFDKPVSLRLVSDLDNAQNTFGKTAHYDPNSMEIVIYTDNRHPKDMLRSLSHELVHHAQNCRGDFDGDHETGEGYAQNDPYMREKEAEAYLIGNGFMVRDYEDSLKEKNKMLSEDKIREMVREGLKKALFEQTEVQEGEKPDFLDIDKDGDKEESMKDAAADSEKSETVEEAHCGKRDDDVEEAHCGKRDDDEQLEEDKNLDEVEEVEEASTKDTPDRVSGRDSARRLRPLEEESEITVESRLQDKNNFLFEKLTKMWTK